MIVAVGGMAGSGALGSRVALVVGNRRYRHAGELTNATNDASAIAAALSRVGFSGIKRSDDDYEVDAGVVAIEDVSYQQLCRALGAFGRVADQARQAVIYYAGHGIEFGRENYLVPVDARLAHRRNVEFEAVSLTRVLGTVDGANGLRLVILDACRKNPFRSRLYRDRTRGEIRGLRSIDDLPSNVLVAYAAKHGTVASDGIGQRKNSPFAEALLENIEEPGLEVQFLFRKVKTKVLAATGGAQEPWVYESLGEEPHYLVPPGPIAAAPVVRQSPVRSQYVVRRQARRVFQDADFAPLMIRVPGGDFLMGSLETSDPGSRLDERPAHPVTLRSFSVGVFPVTIGNWEQARKRGFDATPRIGGRDVPVTSISWHDANAYTIWLSKETGHNYRLLTEAEWEYACRATTLTPYSTGPHINTFEAWFSGKYIGKKGRGEAPVLEPIRAGVHSPNKFGVCDMHGNVYEWVEDDYHASYVGAPDDGSAWVSNPSTNYKVLRGGCFASGPRQLRSARRARCHINPNEPRKIGFRIARDV